MRDYAVLYVNKQKYKITGHQLFLPLSTWLREEISLTGTKVVCSEGDCGACTVLISERNCREFKAVNSCISPVFANDGRHIVTIEGLDQMRDESHAVVKAMVKGNGAQCGFCSPGFTLALTDMFEHHNHVDHDLITRYTTGNLCRCTGYKDIINSALSVDMKDYQSIKDYFLTNEQQSNLRELLQESLEIQIDDKIVLAPTTLEELFKYRQQHPDATLIGAATDIGVVLNKGNLQHYFIYLGKLQGLDRVEVDDHITIGALVTLRELESELKGYYPEFVELLEEFASPQIRNRATLVGNIANGSPIGDSLPFLFAIGASVVLKSQSTEREVAIYDLFKGYRDLDINRDEIIVAVKLPLPDSKKVYRLYKVANRTHLDIATVSATFVLQKDDTNKIEHLAIAYGGVAATPIRFFELEKRYQGKLFSSETCQELGKEIAQNLKPLDDVRSSAKYRLQLCKNLPQKFFHELQGE